MVVGEQGSRGEDIPGAALTGIQEIEGESRCAQQRGHQHTLVVVSDCSPVDAAAAAAAGTGWKRLPPMLLLLWLLTAGRPSPP